jgi:hypothetical protein
MIKTGREATSAGREREQFHNIQLREGDRALNNK